MSVPRIGTDAAHRFVMIDVLRGLASAAVGAYHFAHAIGNGTPLLSSWLGPVLRQGDLGVEVFFVLSGFAIANAVGGTKITLPYVGKFLLRRSIRLDPLYWFVILVSFTILQLRPVAGRMPHFVDLVGNLFYLDNLLGLQTCVPVGWSLCLEVQFYVVLMLGTAGAQGLGRHGFWLVHLPLALFSLVAMRQWIAIDNAWFVPWWCLFFLGVVAQRAASGLVPWWVPLGIALGFAAASGLDRRVVAAGATAALIALAVRQGGLDRWGQNPATQWLGKISYSFYLVHPLIGNRALRWASNRFELGSSPLAAWTSFVMVYALCIGCSYATWRLIEDPSQRWSRRIKLKT